MYSQERLQSGSCGQINLSRICWLSAAVAIAMALAGCGGGGGGAPTPPPGPQGFVEVGLVDSPSTGFQNILLNVESVMLNPIANADNTTPGWVTVPIPSGVGPTQAPTILSTNFSFGGIFGGGGVLATPGANELQIDLNGVQNQVQLFNAALVPAQQYNEIQVTFDVTNPGNIIPNCSAGPSLEGCITYPMQFSSSPPLFATARVPVANGGLTTLVIEFSPGSPQPPNATGGNYVISPQISVVTATTNQANPLMALLAGSVNGTPSATEQVVAELSGTDTIVAKTGLVANNSYSMQLPASADGTAYDLYATGPGASFDVIGNVGLARGIGTSANFNVSAEPFVSISGTVRDGCTGSSIVGATVDLLTSSFGGINCVTSPNKCIAVASGTTDESGTYPMPGSAFEPAPFSTVPATPGANYAMVVSAAGYDALISPVTVSSAGAICSASADGKSCNFDLSTAYIKGTVALGSPTPAGTTSEVEVTAESSGTNELVSALAVPLQIPACANPPCAAAFTLNVPTSGTFDLIATAIDLFAGAPDQFTGHTIAVLSGVQPSPACQKPAAPTVALAPLDCSGHASLSGTTAAPFDTGTTVRLSKADPNGKPVELFESTVGPASSATNAGAFSFCAPADSYSVQRFEKGSPVSSPIPAALAAPSPVATPCPSICSGAAGTCPGPCSNTALSNPL
jgi:hypothetical protein